MEILKAFGIVYITISTVCFTLFLIGIIRSIRKFVAQEKQSTLVDEKIKFVYIEQVDDVVYMYDKLTDSFLLLAPTRDELWAKAEQQFPNLKLFDATKKDKDAQ